MQGKWQRGSRLLVVVVKMQGDNERVCVHSIWAKYRVKQ